MEKVKKVQTTKNLQNLKRKNYENFCARIKWMIVHGDLNSPLKQSPFSQYSVPVQENES